METYTKEYTQLPAAAVIALVGKYIALHQVMGLHALVQMPRIVSHTERSITFAHLDVSKYQSLPDLIVRGDREAVSVACKRLGGLLAQIHLATKDAGYIHGDFWPGNIYLSEREVLLLDWEPPRSTTTDWQPYITGDPELDVACFLEHVIFMFPAAQWYRYVAPHTEWQESFLSGYKEREGALDVDVLKLHRKSVRESMRQNINGGLLSVVKKIALRYVHWRHNIVTKI